MREVFNLTLAYEGRRISLITFALRKLPAHILKLISQMVT